MTHSKSNVGSGSSDIMQSLKGAYHKCEIVNEKLKPCGYHHNRKEAVIYGVCDEGGCPTARLNECKYVSVLHRSPHINYLLQELSYEWKIAGGWWLIKEQREWLKLHLQSAFEQIEGDCHILVAGVAGYAHFYSYLQIVFDAAISAKLDISRLNIDVIDSCIFPLKSIEAIEQSVRTPKKWGFISPLRRKYDVLGQKINLPIQNYRFIKSMIPNILKCKIRTMHGSIMDMSKNYADRQKFYDIITEHFLLSMMESVERLIDKSRDNYNKVMKKGGHLLMACGFKDESYVKNRLLEIHRQHNLVTKGDEIVKVWDPFGITRSKLQYIMNDKDLDATIRLDNCLIDFVCME